MTTLSVREFEPGILLMTLDLPDRGANILNQALFDDLDATLGELATRQNIDGLILTSAKPGIFIAGADLGTISSNLDWPEKEIVKFCEKGRAVMARLSRAPFVTVAAIHGACLGGGLELALWCDCRIATDDRKTQLGLPEVKLGLIPGWAGTARLPRLIGFEPAAELLITGRSVPVNEAKQLGFVDEVATQQELIPAAVELIRRVKTSESFIHNRRSIMGPVEQLNRSTPLTFPTEQQVAQAQQLSQSGIEHDDSAVPLSPELKASIRKLGEKIVDQQSAIYPYAPAVLLEHLARTAYTSQADAWKSESMAFVQVWGSPANRGLLNHFFLVDRNKKKPGLVDRTLKPPKIQSVGVVGAGLMGAAIADSCLRKGVNVLLLDADHEKARSVVEALSARHSTKPTSASIELAEDYPSLASTDLIIESVVETKSVKQNVLAKIEQAVPPQTLLASNTSAIPISELAENLSHPDRFCGIHFCHPELMALVEVPCGQQSSEQTIATAVGFVRQLGKMPVALNDGPGFVVNRLLAAMIQEAIELLTSGYSAEQIDASMRDFGFLGGPFEIIDTIGVDTCVYAGKTMYDAGLTCVSLSPILPKLLKLNRLGRKTGLGIYRYETPSRSTTAHVPTDSVRGVIDPDFAELVTPYQNHDTPSDIPLTELAEQIVSAMVVEAMAILDEGMVDDFRDIDLCVIHGLSFPQHQGGLFFWADTVGLSDKLKGATFYAN